MSNGIKDCTNCMIPHSKNGYDYIFNKIVSVNNERVDKFLKEKYKK